MRVKNQNESSSINESRPGNVEKVISLVTDNLKTMIDTKIVVGESISAGLTTLIPISKVAVGFVAGGGEYDKSPETQDAPFAGGSGAGYSVNPVGFIVITGTDVKFMKVSPSEIASKVVEMVPEVVDAINKHLKK